MGPPFTVRCGADGDACRGHTVAAVCNSFQLAKDCGFKVIECEEEGEADRRNIALITHFYSSAAMELSLAVSPTFTPHYPHMTCCRLFVLPLSAICLTFCRW